VDSLAYKSGCYVSGLTGCVGLVDVAGVVLGPTAMILRFLLFYNSNRQLLLVGGRMGLFRSDREPQSLANKLPYFR
jgi:hypothetical protein